jgi:hypothetical protein
MGKPSQPLPSRETLFLKAATGLSYHCVDYAKPLKKALDIVEYHKVREEQRKARAEGRLLGHARGRMGERDGGVSKEGDLVDLGVANNLVEKSGSWFSYKGERIGQGPENAKQFLKDNADIRQTIDTELRKLLGLIKTEPAPPEPL